MRLRPGIEELEDTMNEDIKREFGHVKEGQDRIETHLYEQDRHQSEHLKKFALHAQDDLDIKNQFIAHLTSHRQATKFWWAVLVGVILTMLSTIGILAVEIIKHYTLKG